MERHDAREREEDARGQRRALAEEPARRQEDERDRGGAEEDLEDRATAKDGPVAARTYA